jgi:UDP-N-acetylglucosamine 2-epimerase (non-hydrolysing)
MKHARLILTDSGGIQEEAPSLGVPVLVLRSTTERPEGVASGLARLVGCRRDDIIREATRELQLAANGLKKQEHPANPYGDGFAGRRIADALLRD